MRPSRWTRSTLPLLILLGCGSFLNPEDYEQLPAFEALDFRAVQPAMPSLLWELRKGTEGGPDRVIARVASAGHLSLSPEVSAAFRDASSSVGFDPECLPGYCFKYFVSVQGTTVRVWADLANALEFIGNVSNKVEAAIVAKVNGFYWGGTRETGGIREVPGGYELAVLALVRSCAPVQVDRFLVHVSTSGTLQVLKQDTWERDSRSCI